MDCSTPGLPVYHQLPKFTQTHVHWDGDAIQPSHPLSSPSPSAFNLPQPQDLFKWVSSKKQTNKQTNKKTNESVLCTRWPKYWSFNFSISVLPTNIQDWPPLGWTGWISLQSKGLSRVLCNTQFKNINSSVLSFLYSPTLTSIHDYWKKYSFD